MTQPAGMTTSGGVILTVGIQVVLDRCAIVIPLANLNDLDKVLGTSQVVSGFFAAPFDLLLDCLCENAYITFLAAEAMIDGCVPHRADYGVTDHPGTRTGNPLPAQVAALTSYYQEPEDVTGGRIRVGKSFVPGISTDDVAGDNISTTLMSALETFAETLLSGFDCDGETFYRVLAAPTDRTPATSLSRLAAHVTRGYVATQRRRLIPH